MGINIGAYRITSVEPFDDYNRTRHQEKSEAVEGWDSSRMGGDRDVPVAEGVDWVSPDWDEDQIYCRPASLPAFKNWVLNSGKIVEGNQGRWLDIIEKMQADERIWLLFGW